MATNNRTGRRPARGKTATRAKAKPAPVEEEIDELEEDAVEEEAPKPTRKPPRKTAAKKAPAPEPDEDLDEEDDEDEDEEAPAPKKAPAKGKGKPPVRKAIEFGTAWLADFIKDQTGKEYKPYDLRVLLRKMAKNGELEREVGTDRGRYEFEGPKDPLVKKIVAKVKKGEIDAAKKDSLDKLKESQKGKRAAKKAAKDEDVEEEEIEDDVDELDDDEDEDEDDDE